MAKVQGILSSKGNVEEFESSQGADRSKNKIRNGLKTAGKIALKVIAATGMLASGIGALVTLSGTAAAAATTMAVAGNVAEVVDVASSFGEGFNSGKIKGSTELELGEMGA